MPVKKRHISDFMLTRLRVVAGFCLLLLFSLGLSATAAHALHQSTNPRILGGNNPVEGQALSAAISNALTDHSSGFNLEVYRWERSSPGSSSGFISIPGFLAGSNNYAPTQSDVGRFLRARVTFTDNLTGEVTSRIVGPTSRVVANANDDPRGLAIAGVPVLGQELTANTSRLADEDGLPNPSEFTYQWNTRVGTTDTPIPNATSRTYTLTQSELGKRITLTLRYTDSFNTQESTTSAATAEVRLNDPPSGLTIAGALTVGEELTADTSTLADEDGLPAESEFSYQWRADGVDIANATDRSYVLTPANIGSQITVTLSYTDNLSKQESLTSPARGPVQSDNNAPTITGTPPLAQVGASYSFMPVGEDADGDTLIYTLSGAPGWLSINPTTGALTGTPGNADVGTTTGIVIDVTDGIIAAPVELAFALTVNGPPTGEVIILDSGRPIVGQVLTADASGLGDANGLSDRSAFSYQWFADSAPIRGANLRTYTPDEVGEVIFVIVSYTDDDGVDEDVSSASIRVFNQLPTADAGPNQSLSKGTEVTLDGSGSSDPEGASLTYLWSQVDGTTVTLSSTTAARPTFTIPNLIPTDDPDSLTFSLVVSDVHDASSTNEETVRIFIRPLFREAIADQTYSLGNEIDDLMLPAALTQEGTSGDVYALSSVPAGLSFDPATRILSGTPTVLGMFGLTYTVTTADGGTDTLEFSITITAVNNPPTGVVTIDGILTEDEVLTANTSTLADEDGLPAESTFTYQWLADGVEIPGATLRTYILTQADVDQILSVLVRYTDDGGTDESVTSAPRGTVANVNDPPTGAVTIAGSLVMGEELTADTSALRDEDGLPAESTFRYRWRANGISIPGATATMRTYRLTAAEVGAEISVRVSYFDLFFMAERITSEPRGPVIGTNEAPTISGTPATMVAEDSEYRFTPVGGDADGHTLIYTIDNRPDWADFDPATGALTGTPGNADVGTTTGIVISVTDGIIAAPVSLPAFFITVINTNDPPTGEVTIEGTLILGEELTADTSALADDDGLPDPATFTYQWFARDGATDTPIFGAMMRTYTLTPNEIDKRIGVRVSYIDDRRTRESLEAVTGGSVSEINLPPTGAVTIRGTLTTGEELTADTSALGDENGLPAESTFTYQWLADDTEISGTTGRTYRLTPNEVGRVITVLVRYTDDDGTAERVTSAPRGPVVGSNQAPTIGGTPATTVAEDSAYNFMPEGGDADGNILTYTLIGAPGWLIINPVTGELTGTPTNDDVGTTTGIVIGVTDGIIAAPVELPAFDLRVTNTNDAPTGGVTITGSLTMGGELTADTSTLADADGLPAEFTFTYQWNTRDGATDTPISGATLRTYTPTQDEVDQILSVLVRYTDDDGATESVTSAPRGPVVNANDAPTIDGTPVTTVAEDSEYSFTPVGMDVDGNFLTYAISGAPGWLSIDPATGELTGTPTNDDVGTTTGIVISVTDGIIAAPVELPAFDLTVTNTNDAPTGAVTISGILTMGEELTADTSTLADDDGLPEPSTFTYQWLADGVEIPGATLRTYTLTPDEVGQTISLVVRYTDLRSSEEEVTSAPRGPVANANTPPTIGGVPATTVAENSEYSFTPVGMDVDGHTLIYAITVTPAWADFNPATGALTGTPTNADVGTTTGIVISVTDGIAAPVELPAFALTVTDINNPPTGAVTVNGILTTGEQLTADTSALADDDGLPDRSTFFYRWIARSGTTDRTLLVGPFDTYTLTADEVDAQIRVTVSYFDFNDTDENLTSAPRGPVKSDNSPPTIGGTPATTVVEGSAYNFTPEGGDEDVGDTLVYAITVTPDWADFDPATGALTGTPTNDDVGTTTGIVISVTDGIIAAPLELPAFDITVTNINTVPTGGVTISGTLTMGEVLTADTSTLADGDGLPDESGFRYTWQADFTSIPNATMRTYTLTPAEIGKRILVIVRYTDGQGRAENVFSELRGPVVGTNTPPTISGVPATTVAEDSEYLFTPTGMDADSDDTLVYAITVTPAWADFNPATGALTGTPTNDDVGITTGIVISVTDGIIAAPLELPAFDLTVTNTNDPATGAVTISGIPVMGTTLTADTSALADDDGLPEPSTFTYQWLANGLEIPGATGPTYTLTPDEVGQTISAIVEFTDDRNTVERVTSAPLGPVVNANSPPTIGGTPATTVAEDSEYRFTPEGEDADGDTLIYALSGAPGWLSIDPATGALTGTPTNDDVGTTTGIVISVTDGIIATPVELPAFDLTVTNTNDPATGAVTIDGILTEDEVLTANTSTLADDDGLPDESTFTYQWFTDDGTASEQISGANMRTYTLTQSDVGEMITVTVSYTDDRNTLERHTSDATQLVTNINDAPTGRPSIDGTPTEDEELTANTSALADEDGLPDESTFTYQWFTDDGTASEQISGANMRTYTLTQRANQRR